MTDPTIQMNEVNATPHAELIAELMNPNNPKNEREYAALREIERLQEALAKPVLQDIEQYRMQMAGICTAAIGYWKEGDGIHPDYDTLALQDVAKLYAKYDALYKAQRPWQGLTDDEMSDIVADMDVNFGDLLWKVVCLTKIIEAKLKGMNT